jgi:hypothetical protein
VAEGTLVTKGIFGPRGFLKACDNAGKETKKQVRGTFRKVGDIVKVKAAARFESYDARSAAGYRTVVRQRGVSVEQSLRKTTGKRPDFGALQMSKALIPALDDKADEVGHAMEAAIDKVADHFETA